MNDTVIKRNRSALASAPIGSSLLDALKKLDPRVQRRNPVMLVVLVGTLLTFALGLEAGPHDPRFGFIMAVAAILFATVVLANFAESIAEARGRGQAASLRSTRSELVACRVTGGQEEHVPAAALRKGELVRVSAGELIPADGEIIEGLASINEAAVTGESAPVLREAGTDKSGVIAGTKVLTDSILVEVRADPGDSFLDRMIRLVEGAQRQKTPNELALTVLLSAMTLIFLGVTVSLPPMAQFLGFSLDPVMLIALLVCLIPTTIGGLLPAIGIAGMDRALRANVIAKSGKAVELAGDIDTLLLDKTGTITYGDRQAMAFRPLPGISTERLARAAQIASLADPTPEGKSIVRLAERSVGATSLDHEARVIEFSARLRMSGIDLPGQAPLRKGASDAIVRWVLEQGGNVPSNLQVEVDQVARRGATPLVVAEGGSVLGVVELSDIVKSGVRDRFARLRALGVRTVMITGDNPLTAAAIAAQAGVDDFMAEATPVDKLARIRSEQSGGRLVAMVGDGTNDAPALAQADIGLAMNAGTQAAKEAGNMVDLDSDPSKLLDVVEIGKQLLVTRGALTTFSLANDVSKYFAILPAIFAAGIPSLAVLNIMGLSSPANAVLAALIFNALVIPALIPLALRGVRVSATRGDALLARNLLIYGVGGVLVPFPAIKLIDMALVATLGT